MTRRPKLSGGAAGAVRPPAMADGRFIVATTAETRFASDQTAVGRLDFAALRERVASQGFTVERTFSRPLPRPAVRMFKLNAFVLVAQRRNA